MVSFIGLSPKQAQAVEVLNNHFSLPDGRWRSLSLTMLLSLSRVRRGSIN